MEVLESEYTNGGEPKKRPVFLTVLCILTLVATGIGFFAPLIMLVRGVRSETAMQAETDILLKAADQMREMGVDAFAKYYEQTADMNVQLNQNVYGYAAMILLAVILGIFGAIFMLRGKKLGFHLYIGYCLLAMITPYLFASAESIPMLNTILGAIFSLLFIFMYSRNLHWLK